MRKEEFLKQLEFLLNDIPQEERIAAMEFYRSYFEDAGIGNENRIIEELESPEKVAEIIKQDLGFDINKNGYGRTKKDKNTYYEDSPRDTNTYYRDTQKNKNCGKFPCAVT